MSFLMNGFQRFGGALNLNVHVHALVLDGVFAKDRAGTVNFGDTCRMPNLKRLPTKT